MDKERIQKAVRELLLAIGENPDREGLMDTPRRVADMYEEIFAGLHREPLACARTFCEEYDHEMVLLKDIPVYSMCEHHLLPFFGTAAVAYLPSTSQVLGLSKIARIVDILSRKPQLQERLCHEIVQAIEQSVPTAGVLVQIEAEHTCMTMRGIKKPGSKTVTIASSGLLGPNQSRRQEVLSLLATR